MDFPMLLLAIRLSERPWYTPAVYIEAARRVLGAIDLDPASNGRREHRRRGDALLHQLGQRGTPMQDELTRVRMARAAECGWRRAPPDARPRRDRVGHGPRTAVH